MSVSSKIRQYCLQRSKLVTPNLLCSNIEKSPSQRIDFQNTQTFFRQAKRKYELSSQQQNQPSLLSLGQYAKMNQVAHKVDDIQNSRQNSKDENFQSILDVKRHEILLKQMQRKDVANIMFCVGRSTIVDSLVRRSSVSIARSIVEQRSQEQSPSPRKSFRSTSIVGEQLELSD